jgi:hypothetical protein
VSTPPATSATLQHDGFFFPDLVQTSSPCTYIALVSARSGLQRTLNPNSGRQSNADESKKGATKEDLDNMRGVLQRQVDEKMPWLSDVLGEHLDKLVSSSSSDSDD